MPGNWGKLFLRNFRVAVFWIICFSTVSFCQTLYSKAIAYIRNDEQILPAFRIESRADINFNVSPEPADLGLTFMREIVAEGIGREIRVGDSQDDSLVSVDFYRIFYEAKEKKPIAKSKLAGYSDPGTHNLEVKFDNRKTFLLVEVRRYSQHPVKGHYSGFEIDYLFLFNGNKIRDVKSKEFEVSPVEELYYN